MCVPVHWVFHLGFILPASYTKIHAGENIVFPAGLSRDRACAWDSEHYLLAKHRSSAIHTESSVHASRTSYAMTEVEWQYLHSLAHLDT